MVGVSIWGVGAASDVVEGRCEWGVRGGWVVGGGVVRRLKEGGCLLWSNRTGHSGGCGVFVLGWGMRAWGWGTVGAAGVNRGRDHNRQLTY